MSTTDKKKGANNAFQKSKPCTHSSNNRIEDVISTNSIQILPKALPHNAPTLRPHKIDTANRFPKVVTEKGKQMASSEPGYHEKKSR
jgi:hypothetical protein